MEKTKELFENAQIRTSPGLMNMQDSCTELLALRAKGTPRLGDKEEIFSQKNLDSSKLIPVLGANSAHTSSLNIDQNFKITTEQDSMFRNFDWELSQLIKEVNFMVKKLTGEKK